MTTFYDLPKEERIKLAAAIQQEMLTDIETGDLKKTTAYFGDNDT